MAARVSRRGTKYSAVESPGGPKFGGDRQWHDRPIEASHAVAIHNKHYLFIQDGVITTDIIPKTNHLRFIPTIPFHQVLSEVLLMFSPDNIIIINLLCLAFTQINVPIL